jgi:hypothetical protein
MEEYVGNFEIAVDDIFVSEVEQPLEDVLDDGFNVVFGEVVLPSQFTLQIAPVAYFGNDVTVAIGGEYLVTPEYVGMVEFLEYINF